MPLWTLVHTVHCITDSECIHTFIKFWILEFISYLRLLGSKVWSQVRLCAFTLRQRALKGRVRRLGLFLLDYNHRPLKKNGGSQGESEGCPRGLDCWESACGKCPGATSRGQPSFCPRCVIGPTCYKEVGVPRGLPSLCPRYITCYRELGSSEGPPRACRCVGKQGLARAALGGPPGEPLVFFSAGASCVLHAQRWNFQAAFVIYWAQHWFAQRACASISRPTWATAEKAQIHKSGQASPWVRSLGQSGGKPWPHAHFRETELRRERKIVGCCKLFMLQNLSKRELNMINKTCMPRKHVRAACTIVWLHISSTMLQFSSTESKKVVTMIQFHFLEYS